MGTSRTSSTLSSDSERTVPGWWVLAVAVLLMVTLTPWYFYSPDDLFIHLRFADNLVHHGEWAFNPGEPSAGATSPPWVLLIAVPVAAGVPGAVAAKGVATIVVILVVVLVGVACRRAGAPVGLAALAMLCVAGSHWLRLWSAAGMETPLPPLLLVGGFLLGLGPRPRPLLSGVLLGVATTARPDAIPAAVVLCAFVVWRLERNKIVGFCVAAVGAAVAWPLMSSVVLGRWLPLTLSAKGGGGLLLERVVPALARTTAVAASEMLPLLLLAGMAVVLDVDVRGRWRVWAPPLVAALTLPVGYAVNQCTGGVAATGRYLVPWFVLAALASVLCLLPWWREPRRRRWVIVAAALTLLQSAVLTVVHAPATKHYDDYHNRSLLRAAHWLRKNASPDDWVVAGDIGVLGYIGRVKVLDIAGIVNPQAQQWARSGTTFEALQERRPRYFVNPGWYVGFDPSRLDRYTDETIFSNRHTSYRWSLHPGEFEASLSVLDWDR